MNKILLFVGSFLASLVCGFAQTATLTATAATLSAQGGNIGLVATLAYPADAIANPPAAIGFKINLPPGWSLDSTGGPNVPDIVPLPGTTGTLDYAYSSFSTNQINFAATITYPAGLTVNQAITASAIFRSPLIEIAIAELLFTPPPTPPTFTSASSATFVAG